MLIIQVSDAVIMANSWSKKCTERLRGKIKKQEMNKKKLKIRTQRLTCPVDRCSIFNSTALSQCGKHISADYFYK